MTQISISSSNHTPELMAQIPNFDNDLFFLERQTEALLFPFKAALGIILPCFKTNFIPLVLLLKTLKSSLTILLHTSHLIQGNLLRSTFKIYPEAKHFLLLLLL